MEIFRTLMILLIIDSNQNYFALDYSELKFKSLPFRVQNVKQERSHLNQLDFFCFLPSNLFLLIVIRGSNLQF